MGQIKNIKLHIVTDIKFNGNKVRLWNIQETAMSQRRSSRLLNDNHASDDGYASTWLECSRTANNKDHKNEYGDARCEGGGGEDSQNRVAIRDVQKTGSLVSGEDYNILIAPDSKDDGSPQLSITNGQAEGRVRKKREDMKIYQVSKLEKNRQKLPSESPPDKKEIKANKKIQKVSKKGATIVRLEI